MSSARPILSLLLALVPACTTDASASQQEPDPRLDWWREARFGLFLHWGLYAIPAGEWQGRTDHAEWIRHTAQIPLERYDQFVGQFDPRGFDADAWARLAQQAGMRYVVITSKHHDGFCLFDSAQTDFDVMSTPFRRDIMKELADACRRHRLQICWYHSIMDWHHPDYLPRRPWEEQQRPATGADLDRFERYLHGQVEELLTHYGPIGVMWFDGEWEATWNHARGQRLYDLCRRLQPAVIVNNRVDVGRAGMAGMNKGSGYAGDFGTPEQEVPSRGLPGVDWESCLTMNRNWGFNANDHHWKSTRELVRTLVDIASKGGNLLLNVGPRSDGTFPPEAVDRLQQIGVWMQRHGEAIHGTRASPFDVLPFGRCTWREQPQGARLYLHVFDRPTDGRLVVPGLGNEVRGCRLLGGGDLPCERADSDVHVQLAGDADPYCTVVALDVAGEPIVYLPPRIEAAADVFVRPLQVSMQSSSPALELRYTLDGSEPGQASERYTAPFTLAATTTVAARAFHGDRAVTPVVRRTLTRVEPRPPVEPAPGRTGLSLATYAGTFDRLPDFARLQPANRESVPLVALPQGVGLERTALRFTGFLRVPTDDVYTFALTSDDGSRLRIAATTVVDNDGLHGAETVAGVIALAAGLHTLEVEWFNKTGGQTLELQWAPLGGGLQPVPNSALAH